MTFRGVVMTQNEKDVVSSRNKKTHTSGQDTDCRLYLVIDTDTVRPICRRRKGRVGSSLLGQTETPDRGPEHRDEEEIV